MFYYNINQNMKANTVYILIHGNTEIDFFIVLNYCTMY